MFKKNNSIKLLKYYNLINYNLIYNNKAINRYKKDNFELSENTAKKLVSLKKSILSLKNCELKKNAKQLVFADGNNQSKIMIIGEGPGQKEDEQGKPFVGDAGILLNKMLEAIQIKRNNIYITNVVNDRPPNNRKPEPS